MNEENVQAAMTQLSAAMKRVAEEIGITIERVKKAIVDVYKINFVVERWGKVNCPKQYYLATHSKKARTRKKNMNIICSKYIEEKSRTGGM